MRKWVFLFWALLYGQHTWAEPTVIPEVNAHAKPTLNVKKEASTQTTHLTRDEIQKSPTLNLSGFLRQEQSIVRLTNTSSTGQSALSIRGFGDNAAANSLILVDGFPLINPTLLSPDFNSIALSDIERIDIIQGSEGTLYGDQAVGGVVNIITRHPEKLIADIYAGIGNNDQLFLGGLVGDKFKNGFYGKIFGFTNQTSHYRAHNRQTNATVAALIGKDYARGTFYFNLQAYQNNIDLPGELTQAQFDDYPTQATNNQNHTHEMTTLMQVLTKHALSTNWLLETRIMRRDVRSNGFSFFSFTSDQWLNQISPRLIGRIANNKIIAGYDWQNNYYELENVRAQVRARSQQNDIYGQITIPVQNNVDLTLGSRYAWQNNAAEKKIGQTVDSTNRVWVTEQGITWRLTPVWQLFLRRDGNFSFPKANEQTWTPANTSALDVQEGVSYETGITRQGEHDKMQLSIYQLDLTHEISFDPTQTAQNPFGSFRNFDHTRRRGVTLTEDYQIITSILFNTQINYVDPRFTSGPFSGNVIPAVPMWNANVSLAYEFAHAWQVRYTALYTGTRYASNDVNNIGKMQSSYWLHLASIQYILKPVTLSFEINNLFNQQYSTYTLFDPATHTNTYYPGAGRSYLLTAKIDLN